MSNRDTSLNDLRRTEGNTSIYVRTVRIKRRYLSSCKCKSMTLAFENSRCSPPKATKRATIYHSRCFLYLDFLFLANQLQRDERLAPFNEVPVCHHDFPQENVDWSEEEKNDRLQNKIAT